MGFCRIHGKYAEFEDGCPSCQQAEREAGQAQEDLNAKIRDIGRAVRDPGDYFCPHCRYRSLRKGASRCPTCHGAVSVEYWQQVEIEEAKQREAQLAAEKVEQERKRVETEQWVLKYDKQRRAEKRTRTIRRVLVAGAVVAALLAMMYCGRVSSRRTSPTSAAPSPATLVVAADQARIRVAPSLDARVISSLMSGALVEDLGSQGEWKHIRLLQESGQIEGWMHGSLFSPKGADREAGGVPLEALAREQRTDEKFAVASVSGNDVPVLARITTGEVRLSANSVTPPGNAIGQPSFVIRSEEKVDVVAAFANDGESRLTCKVRSKARELGFLPCGRLRVLEWIGDRGELLEIVAGQPYEYEGDWAAVEKDIAKLSAFVEKHPKSRFAAYAELKILGLRFYIGQAEGAQGEGARAAALSDLSYLKSHGTLRHSGTRIQVRWPAEARERGWLDQGAAGLTPWQSGDLYSFVRGLSVSVPSPIWNPTDESASPPAAAT